MPLASRRTLVYIILQCVNPPSWNVAGRKRGGTPGPSGMRPHWAVTVVATEDGRDHAGHRHDGGSARAGRRPRPTREAGHERMIRRRRCRRPTQMRPSPNAGGDASRPTPGVATSR